MKTRISQLVAALFFVFVLAGNVNATAHDVKASSHESIETILAIENWITDENVWSTSDFGVVVAEANLEMENWMTNQFVWDVQSQELALENWMTDKNIWEVESAMQVETIKEKDLAMEQWMLNENIWDI